MTSRSRKIMLPLCFALMRPSGVLGPVLNSPVQERHGHTRESIGKGHQDKEGTEIPVT